MNETISAEEKSDDNVRPKKKLTLAELQKHLMSVLVGAICSAALLSVTFYFHTNYTLSIHSDKLDELSKRMDVTEEKMQAVQTDLTTIKSQVSDIKESQNLTQGDVKKIYELLVGMKK